MRPISNNHYTFHTGLLYNLCPVMYCAPERYIMHTHHTAPCFVSIGQVIGCEDGCQNELDYVRLALNSTSSPTTDK